MLRKLIASLLLIASLVAGPDRAQAADFTQFGGSPLQQRNNLDEADGRPLYALTPLVVGASRSQPIVVGDTVFALAGDYLWKFRVRPPQVPPDSLDPPVIVGVDSPPANIEMLGRVAVNGGTPSQSHPTYSPENGVIYLGSGDQRIVAVDPDSLTIRGCLPLRADVVSAPLAFPGDAVVFGTRDGYVHVVRGLASAGCPAAPARIGHQYRKLTASGAVTGSPVPVRDLGSGQFIIGVDGAPGGLVVAVSLDLRPVWSSPFATPNGVPASFSQTRDGEVYFSDKRGLFYKVDARTGRADTVWRAPRLDGEGWFINNSPSLARDKVFFTLRGKGPNGESGSGMVLALDKRTGQEIWRRRLSDITGESSRGNTAPFYWEAAGVVAAGDTAGIISFLNASTGDPAPILAWRNQNEELTREPLVDLTGGWEAETRTPWNQLAGAGAEMTVANGIVAVGANLNYEKFESVGGYYTLAGKTLGPTTPDPDTGVSLRDAALANPDGPGRITGLLFVGVTSPAIDLILRDPVPPPTAEGVGQPVTIHATADYWSGNPIRSYPVNAPVGWRWKGEQVWQDAGVVSLRPGGSAEISIQVPARNGEVELKINPREDQPWYEKSFANNTVTVPVAVAGCPELNAGIDIKGNTWRTGDEVPVVFWTVRNTQGQSGPIPVRVTVSVGGESQSRTVSLAPGKGTSGQVLYVPGSPGTLTASLRAEVQGTGAGCRTTWTASDSATIIPPPPDVQWTKPDTGVRLWGWR